MTPEQAVPIDWARAIGKRRNYLKVAIIYTDGKTYGITTYGKTRAECQALARWCGSYHGEDAATSIMDAK